MKAWLLVLAACGNSNASGQVTLTGSPTFDARRCRPGEEFGLDGAQVFHGADESDGYLMVRGGPQAVLAFVPPGHTGEELAFDPHSHCSTFDIDGSHARFDCDAGAGRRLVGALELGTCK